MTTVQRGVESRSVAAFGPVAAGVLSLGAAHAPQSGVQVCDVAGVSRTSVRGCDVAGTSRTGVLVGVVVRISRTGVWAFVAAEISRPSITAVIPDLRRGLGSVALPGEGTLLIDSASNSCVIIISESSESAMLAQASETENNPKNAQFFLLKQRV